MNLITQFLAWRRRRLAAIEKRKQAEREAYARRFYCEPHDGKLVLIDHDETNREDCPTGPAD